MKKNLVFWVENYFYNPNPFQRIISIILLPFSWLYCFSMYIRFKLSTPEHLGIDVVSIGNLSVGGSGKTPLVTALAEKYDDSAVVLRGYGRDSRGLYVVSNAKDILEDVSVSGDEAMIYAQKLSNTIVIVSEDRNEGILKAKDLGAKIVFLDDAYSKHNIEKLDILIDVESKNSLCLPSGPFRERLWDSKEAVIVKDGIDFIRVSKLKDKCDKMSLVTAIARPGRLDSYLPDVVSKNYFEDHHSFTKDEVEDIIKRDGSDSILVTYKDYVKLESFGLPISLLDLEVKVNDGLIAIIDKYRGINSAKKD